MTQQTSEQCQICGKHLKPLRPGSMTSWLRIESTCTCPNPKAPAAPPLANRARMQARSELGMTVTIKADRHIMKIDSNITGLPTKLQDQYEIVEKIGEGGMGTVFSVKNRVTNEIVALKILNQEQTDDIKSIQRFEQEALSVRKLRHQNIVSIIDYGAPLNDAPYILMEYIAGKDLSAVLDSNGPMTADQVIDVALQVCEALDHAHGRGIVHRDLKPSNIIISDQEPLIKVVDFGIAKILEYKGSRSALTDTGDVTGSPFYMSPEQCSGTEMDARSDIYSFGCLLFEMLTGTPPFVERNPIKVILNHVTEPPREITKSFPSLNVPSALSAIVHKCLQKRPQDRYQSAADLRSDLWLVKQGRRPSAILNSVYRRAGILTSIAAAIAVAAYAGLKMPEWINNMSIHKDANTTSTTPVSTITVGSARADTSSSAGSAPQSLEIAGSPAAAKIQSASEGEVRTLVEKAQNVRDLQGKPTRVVSYIRTVKDRSRETEGLFDLADKQLYMFLDKLHDISELYISDPYISDKALDMLTKMNDLTRLTLRDCDHISDSGLARLRKCQRIQALYLTDGERLTNAALKQIKTLPLELLSLEKDNVDDGCVDDLTSMKTLRWITLASTNISNRGLKTIFSGLPQLTAINLDKMPCLTDSGLGYLSTLKKLNSLSLANNPLLGTGIPQLAAIDSLKILNLDGTAIRDSDLTAFTCMRHLTTLSLNRTAITDDGLNKLAAIAPLRKLYITATPAVTEQAIRVFKSKRPDVEIRHLNNGTQDEGVQSTILKDYAMNFLSPRKTSKP